MRMFWRNIQRWLQDSPDLKPASRGQRGKRRLGFDNLEERTTPAANFSFTSATLVDSANIAITSPVNGERLALRVNWNTTGAAAEQYVVRATIGGTALDSQTITAANGANTTTLTGWYASPGVTNFQVLIDANDAVTESNEGDNTFSSIFTPTPPTTLPTKFGTPINVTTITYQDWAITNYVDIDPRTGQSKDWNNGVITTDGQTGIDFTLPTFAAMDSGIDRVLAAGSGFVEAVSDGSFDREVTTSLNPANFVRINHGNGWKTEYYNVARNTTTVKVGDAVAQGQTIALVGSSGTSSAPHLTFIVTHNGVPVDTYLDGANYWKAPLSYQGTAGTRVMDKGITNYIPNSDLLEKPNDTVTFPTTSNWNVNLYLRLNYLNANDVVTADWVSPSSGIVLTNSYTAATFQKMPGVVLSLPFDDYRNDPGTWVVQVSINTVGLTNIPFDVTAAAGASNFRMTAAGKYINRDRISPIEFGTVAVGGATNTQTFSIVNTGSSALDILNLSIPSGFSLTAPPPPSTMTLLAGANMNFTIRIDNATPGEKIGALRFSTSLGSVQSYFLRAVVTGAPVAGTPNLFFPGSAATTWSTTSPFVLEPNALLADSDSANFNGGRLVVEFLNGIRTENALAVRNQGVLPNQIGVNGANITFSGTNIGTETKTATSLTVVFNNNATPAAVQALIRNITFEDNLAVPSKGARHIRFVVSDNLVATAKTSNAVIKTVYPAAAPLFSSLVTVTETSGNTTVNEGGSSDSYSIVLNSQPTSNVTVSIFPLAQVNTLATSFLFTPLNWSSPQSTTVFAFDDSVAEGVHSGAITHSVSSADVNFNGVIIPNVTPSINDNDSGIVITPSGGSTNVTEDGVSDSVSLSLGSIPTGNVVLTLTPDSQVTTSVATLTFTALTWNIPQTFTINAVDDGKIEKAHSGSVGITSASSDAAYNGITVPSIAVSIGDNDIAGVVFIPAGSSLAVTEGGGGDTYTVRLTSQPTSSVIVNIDTGTQLSTNPTPTLTFTALNWNIAQTVTVNAVDDLIAEGAHIGFLNHTLTTTDLDYIPLVFSALSVGITDNDIASLKVTESANTTDVVEGGATDTISFVLTSQPLSNVTVTVLTDTQTTVNQTSLTFTPGDWNVTQSVIVTAVDDGIAEGFHIGDIDISANSSDPNYIVNSIPTILVNIIDGDSAGVFITPTGVSTDVVEGGAGDSYSVVLAIQPSDNVTITLNPGGQLVANPITLNFSTTNWDQPQTVNVTAIDDFVAEGAHTGTITYSVDSVGDAAYDVLTVANTIVNITDNDTVGVIVTQTGVGNSVTEAGNSDSVTVRLNSKPTQTVTVVISPDTQLFTAPSTLTFTTANWNQEQTITIVGVDDVEVEGNHSGSITFAVSSGDVAYNNFVVPALNVAISDNDALGVTINQSNSSTTVTEGGNTDTYTVTLTAQPTADVTINITVNNQVTLSATSLVFTPANFNLPQIVTITAIDDAIAETSQMNASVITHAATSSDANYNAVAIGTVDVAIVDNDVVGILVQDTSGGTVLTEGGSADSVLVSLTSKPANNVVVNVAADAQLSVNIISLNFTTDNWNVPQTVQVTAINDAVAEGTHPGTITFDASSADAQYNALANVVKSINITDNDTAGVTFTPSGGTTVVTEGAGADSYSIVLTSRPTTTVTVTFTDPSRVIRTPVSGSIQFTTTNWSTPQVIQVIANDDDVAQGTQQLNLTHTLTGDATYAALTLPSIPVTVNDDDFAGIVIFPGNFVISATEGSSAQIYTVNLNSKPTANVTVNLGPDGQVSSSAPSLLFTPANWDTPQQVSVTALNDTIPEGAHEGRITHIASSTDAGYSSFTGPNLIVEITDDDYGVVFQTPSTGVVVTEGLPTIGYSVRLSLPPTSDVTVTLVPESPLVVSTTTLTFTSTNWNQPQSVLVRAPNDSINSPLRLKTITHNTASADANYVGTTRDLEVKLLDTLPDVFGRTQSGQWYVNSSTGSSFTVVQPISWSNKVTWLDVRTADFNGDGRDDIVGRVKENGEVWVSVSTGNAGYVNRKWTTWDKSVTWADVVVGDFDNDGRADLAARHKESGNWWVSKSTGTAFVNQFWTNWSPKVTWVDVAVGDFDGDHRIDISGRVKESGEWWVGQSTGTTFTNTRWVTWNPKATWADVSRGDFNGDGKTDIVGRHLQAGKWYVGLSDGSSFTTSSWVTWNAGVSWSNVSFQDFDGDGKTDIVGRFGSQFYVAVSTGANFTTSLWANNLPTDFVSYHFADFTGDGKADFSGRRNNGEWLVYASGGTGFNSATLWATWAAGAILADELPFANLL